MPEIFAKVEGFFRSGLKITRSGRFYFFIAGRCSYFSLMHPILIICCLLFSTLVSAQDRLPLESGQIYFRSDAPLELIEAGSTELRGLIEPGSRHFAFAVRIRSFTGFNSPLQQEHFNENYLESHRYPEATFSGRIIEPVDFSTPGEYSVRAKGKLQVHGREQERIIRGTLQVQPPLIILRASFTVPLADHAISIPRVVYQKIAEEIEVSVEGRFKTGS